MSLSLRLKDNLSKLSKDALKEVINALSVQEADSLLHDWEMWARPNQLLPKGDWETWAIIAGRGFGKTRCGSETVKKWVKDYPLVNLIAATADDARDIMIEGESGILACCSNAERPRYIANRNCLNWPNGAKSLIFTAAEPERLRGKQHMKLWCDETGSWRYRASYDQAKFGLRLGNNPQIIITTTPRPTPLIKEILKDPGTIVTRGTTYDNRANLAKQFFNAIIKSYEGTRLGRQELLAELLDDNPGALWQRANLDANRAEYLPFTLRRIVIGVDPSTTSKATSDETGIIVAGLGDDNRGYVLEDLSGIYTPAEWAKIICDAYHRWGADRVVAETNNGGDMIEALLRTVDANVSYRSVHATRGKAIRAEPVSSLYERNMISHVGFFAVLEDQMCDFDPKNPPEKSPDRLDGMVWAFHDLYSGTGFIYATL